MFKKLVIIGLFGIVLITSPSIFYAQWLIPPIFKSETTPAKSSSLQQKINEYIQDLKYGTPEARENAATALGKIIPAAKEAVPALIEALKEENTRRSVAEALGKIGPVAKDAVPALIKVLKDKRSWVKCTVATALGNIGDASAVPALIEALKDGEVRESAVMALGEIGDKLALKSLTYVAQNDKSWSGDLSRITRKAIKKIEIKSMAAIPVLIAALEDKDADIKRCAAIALGKLGDTSGISVLIDLFSSSCAVGDPPIKPIANALGSFGPAAKDAGPVLIRECLSPRDEDYKLHSEEALNKIGPLAYIEIFRKEYGGYYNEYEKFKDFATKSLFNMGEPIIPFLMETLKDTDGKVKSQTVYILGMFGLAAKDAVPGIKELLNDKDVVVRCSAAIALCKIDNTTAISLSSEILKILKESLKHEKEFKERFNIAVLLAKFKSKESIPVFKEALTWESYREEATQVLEKYYGGKVKKVLVSSKRDVYPCVGCQVSGLSYLSGSIGTGRCPTCGGTGKVGGPGVYTTTCPNCGGTGKCSMCGGKGYTSEEIRKEYKYIYVPKK